MLEELKNAVCRANVMLSELRMAIFTWGNVSGIDRQSGLVVIKPSGVSYEQMRPENMVIVDMEGNTVEGNLRPSSDTPTHIELYKKYSAMAGIVHTHSQYATSFAQCRRPIPALGTTHADYFYGGIPCTRPLTAEETEEQYEANTGRVIIETLLDRDVMEVPAVLVACHGVFTWGKNSLSAVMNAAYLEESAKLAYHSLMIDGKAQPVDQYLLDKHYLRKHGESAYYGQKDNK